MHSLLHHPDNQACFDNVIHPLIRDQPHVFGSIVHKLLVTRPGERLIMEQYELAFELFKCFMICGTDSFARQRITFINRECTDEDHWKFLRFWNDFHVYFWKYIESVTFLRQNSTFRIKMNGPFRLLVIFQTLRVTIYGGEDDINWAMIPSFVKNLTVHYDSEDFRTVNLSLIDRHCALESLTIEVRDGFIHLPSNLFPATLNTLQMYRYSRDWNSTADITDYEALQNVGRYIDNLIIYENGRSLSWNTLHNVLLVRKLNKLRRTIAPNVEEEEDSRLLKWIAVGITFLSAVVIVSSLVWAAQIDPSR